MEVWTKYQDKALSSKELICELAQLGRKQAKKTWEDLENAEGQEKEQESHKNSMKCLFVHKMF